MNFTWVSPYDENDRRGGWKSFHHYLLQALEQQLGSIDRLTGLQVPENTLEKWRSRLQKVARFPRDYAFYSRSRLDAYAAVLDARLICVPPDRGLIFFGALPFVHYTGDRRYYVCTDGCFHIHYHQYTKDHSHSKASIDRICQAEAKFLQRAAGIFVTSKFAADRIREAYGVPASQTHVVGIGPGDVPPPPEQVTYGEFVLLVMADFERKRGRFAYECALAARRQGAGVRLVFVGATPPPDILASDFTEFRGWLDLARDEDREKFRQAMAECAFLMLPSKIDLTPHVILEAAMYSKATLATAIGGIPEMIEDKRSGLLFDAAATPAQVAKKMVQIWSNKIMLREMGETAQKAYRDGWTWPRVAAKISAVIGSRV